MRARGAEAALAAGEGIESAAAALGQEITPIDDARSTADYRRVVSQNLLRQFWTATGSAESA
jgi:xanthine dehydrogenase iron-sulfur cluster and FAD-binding subunit A